MASTIISDELRELFREELREDPNATLGTTQIHLAELCESAPSDSISGQTSTLTELTELLKVHTIHTPLSDFVTEP